MMWTHGKITGPPEYIYVVDESMMIPMTTRWQLLLLVRINRVLWRSNLEEASSSLVACRYRSWSSQMHSQRCLTHSQ
jgi:hypothetical protein